MTAHLTISRTFSAALLLTGLMTASAVALDGDGLKACRSIEDDMARLACYDAAIDDAATVTADPSDIATPATPPTPQISAEQAAINAFGAEDLPQEAKAKPEKIEVDAITSTVSEASLTARKKAVIFLANGQVWRQIDADDTRVSISRAIGKPVEVKEGTFNSKRMSIDGKRAFRVERIR